ncbi:MAG: peptidoglycan DD-metalloendopeptidase family protein [Ignavibacteriae bacterium]|nr:peptidoglycan DD-metalloendopeptidase family protein [Ignavibacteriota bacterium]
MNIKELAQLFPIHLPIANKGKYWNGKPDEFSNIGFNLNYSQKFGHTPYAETGVYGYYNGKKRPHNGHDFAGQGNPPLVTPCKVWVSFIGYDKGGYGYFCFMETEAKSINGETVKIEFVLAHMRELPTISLNRWHDVGTFVGYMGSTGMSTGDHTHFGGRPLVRKQDGSWVYLFQDEESQAARGYVDLTELFIEKPVYDKQTLINHNNLNPLKFMKDNEKKLIIEGDGKGRKFIVINGKLHEIKKEREASAALYILNNNGFGTTIDGETIEKLPKDKDF